MKLKNLFWGIALLGVLGSCITNVLDNRTPEQKRADAEYAAEQRRIKEAEKKKAEENRIPTPAEMEAYCDTLIQKQLKSPNSFDKLYSTKKVTNISTGIVIQYDYLAKNAFNAEIRNTARCEFDTRGNLTDISF